MWALVAGFLGGRVLRNGRTPDSVKQARWDRAQAQKAARRASARSWHDQWAVGWFRWTVIGLGVVLVLLAVAAIVG